MPTHTIGLVLEPHDLAAARRCAHEALVLAVDELGDGPAAGTGPERVLARARAVHALGTETDGDHVLVLVSARDAAALVEGAHDVARDLDGQAGPGGAADRHRRTVEAAARVRQLLGEVA